MRSFVLAVLATVLVGCSASPVATPTATTAPGAPPTQIRCIIASPVPAILAVSASTGGIQLSAGAQRVCDGLIANGQGWTAEPTTRSMDDYTSICTSTGVNQGVTLSIWSLPDARSLGIAYDVCAGLQNVAYNVKR